MDSGRSPSEALPGCCLLSPAIAAGSVVGASWFSGEVACAAVSALVLGFRMFLLMKVVFENSLITSCDFAAA